MIISKFINSKVYHVALLFCLATGIFISCTSKSAVKDSDKGLTKYQALDLDRQKAILGDFDAEKNQNSPESKIATIQTTERNNTYAESGQLKVNSRESTYAKQSTTLLTNEEKSEINQDKKPVPNPFGKYFAIVIGNNDYRKLPKLKTAINDAHSVANILEKEYKHNVTLLENSTRAEILLALNKLREELTPTDNLLIYYAGHGWLDKDADEGYWLPVDAEPGNDLFWIPNSAITSKIKAIPAKHILIVSDSCYSGKLGRGLHIKNRNPSYYQTVSSLKARTVISSGGVEPVMDAGGSNNHSVFASYFIKALRENKGIMDGTELFNIIKRPVALNSDQTPDYSDIRQAGHNGGEYIFLRQGK